MKNKNFYMIKIINNFLEEKYILKMGILKIMMNMKKYLSNYIKLMRMRMKKKKKILHLMLVYIHFLKK